MRDIVNNNTDRLRALMTQHKLTAADVARILDRAPHTVRVWRVKDTARPIPPHALELLKLKLQAQGAK